MSENEEIEGDVEAVIEEPEIEEEEEER